MSEHLIVSTAHLRDKADQHAVIADQIAAATRLTHGIGHDVWVAHGPISGPSNKAVEHAEAARKAAGNALKAAVERIQSNLHTAADSYDATDTHHANTLSEQMP